MKISFFLICSILICASCKIKSNSQSESTLSDLVSCMKASPEDVKKFKSVMRVDEGQDIWVYHWTDRDIKPNDTSTALNMIANAIDGANGQMGSGFYVSYNIFSTMTFGKNLIAMKLNKKCLFPNTNITRLSQLNKPGDIIKETDDIVKSFKVSNPDSFGGYLYNYPDEMDAMVIKNIKGIDKKSIKIYSVEEKNISKYIMNKDLNKLADNDFVHLIKELGADFASMTKQYTMSTLDRLEEIVSGELVEDWGYVLKYQYTHQLNIIEKDHKTISALTSAFSGGKLSYCQKLLTFFAGEGIKLTADKLCLQIRPGDLDDSADIDIKEILHPLGKKVNISETLKSAGIGVDDQIEYLKFIGMESWEKWRQNVNNQKKIQDLSKLAAQTVINSIKKQKTLKNLIPTVIKLVK